MTAPLIATDAALDRLVNRLDAGNEIAIDTEFMRERTYQAVLCLIQISVGDEISLIDPLADMNLDVLWPALADGTLVLHAGRQDLEVIFQASGQLPAKLFDTQVAAGLCGLAPQCGYGTLVETVCDVKLAKAHTRENWARRPLRAGALAYASEDVLYLQKLQTHFLEELDKLGRRHWAEEDTKALLEPELYTVDVDSAWARVRGLGRLGKTAQHRAAALARWRENVAIERNLPRGWVIKDPELLQIAELDSADTAAIEKIMDSPRNAKRHARSMLTAMTQANDSEEILVTRNAPPTAEEKQAAKTLAKKIAGIAESLELQPELLAPAREVRAAIAGDRDLRMFRGWRAEVFGNAVAESLDSGQPL